MGAVLQLADLTPGAYVRGLIAEQVMQVLSVTPVTAVLSG